MDLRPPQPSSKPEATMSLAQNQQRVLTRQDAADTPRRRVRRPSRPSRPRTACAASTLTSRPPEVWGSWSSSTRSGSSSAATRTSGPKCAALVLPPPGMLPRTSDATPSITGTGGRVDLERDPARGGDLARVADEPETRDVGAGMDGIRRQRLQGFAGAAIEPDHRRDGRRDRRLGRPPGLQRRRDDAGAERLGQEQHVARPCAGVAPDAIAGGPRRSPRSRT